MIMKSIQNVNREWLKEIRKNKGLTMKQAAQSLGMSWQHYTNIENGRTNPSIEWSYKLAEFYNIDVSWFLLNRVKFTSKENIGG